MLKLNKCDNEFNLCFAGVSVWFDSWKFEEFEHVTMLTLFFTGNKVATVMNDDAVRLYGRLELN